MLNTALCLQDGKSAEYYLRNPEYVTHKQLLAEFENRESGDGEEDNPDVQLMDQGRLKSLFEILFAYV